MEKDRGFSDRCKVCESKEIETFLDQKISGVFVEQVFCEECGAWYFEEYDLNSVEATFFMAEDLLAML